MPADVISKGLLSDLQLEAIVYGCQRHEKHLLYDDGSHSFANNDASRGGKKKTGKKVTSSSNMDETVSTNTKVKAASKAEDSGTKNDEKEEGEEEEGAKRGPRQGFLVGDGAGMGKGK